MGNFYVNIITKDAEAKDIERIIYDNNFSAFIISENDYCVIYEQNCDMQDTAHFAKLLKQVSNDLSCTAFGILNHDDDMLLYSLWKDGKELDHYNSCPGIFSEEPAEADMQPKGGNPDVLCAMFDAINVNTVTDILTSTDYVFGIERHSEMVDALGLPECSVGYGFNYLATGELPENIDSHQVIKINV